MFARCALFVGMISLLVSCADSSGNYGQLQVDQENANGIIGGVEVENNSHLAQRVLNIFVTTPQAPTWSQQGVSAYGMSYQCTGVALTKRVVLTAAHCWKDIPGAVHLIKVPDESGNIVQIPVIGKKIHGLFRFGEQSAFDLALFQLGQDLPRNVEMARLPTARNQIQPVYINAAGFGKSVGMLSSEKGTGTLRVTTLSVKDYNDDSFIFRVDQEHGKGICQGDSGGPAYAQYKGRTYLVGIASKVSGLEKTENIHRDVCDQEGYYVKVDNNLGWIHRNLVLLK